jgi:hypothetical protein
VKALSVFLRFLLEPNTPAPAQPPSTTKPSPGPQQPAAPSRPQPGHDSEEEGELEEGEEAGAELQTGGGTSAAAAAESVAAITSPAGKASAGKAVQRVSRHALLAAVRELSEVGVGTHGSTLALLCAACCLDTALPCPMSVTQCPSLLVNDHT